MSKLFTAGIGAAVGGGLAYGLARFADKRQTQCLIAYSPTSAQQVAQTTSMCDAKDPLAVFANSNIPWWMTTLFGVLSGGLSGYAVGTDKPVRQNKKRRRRAKRDIERMNDLGTPLVVSASPEDVARIAKLPRNRQYAEWKKLAK